MTHRGACGCEENTGDGAGMLVALPHRFLVRVTREELGLELPAEGRYGAGIIFLPKDPAARDMAACERAVEACMGSADFIEGRRAFMEKRKPAFTGR